MKFLLEINCDNAAFEGDDREAEVSGILNNVAQVLVMNIGRTSAVMHDSNGNTVGRWRFSED